MKKLPHIRPSSGGFALVVTLSIVVLLALISVGMLTLSALSLRTAARGAAQAEARANARLAVMLAVGELQKHAGPDTRVTAPADVLDANHPPLTGVWRSWEGTNHESTGAFAGRPVAPAYGDKLSPETDGGRFMAWLVSGGEFTSDPTGAGQLVRKTPGGTSVSMVAAHSLAADDDRQVHLEPVRVGEGGSVAWWVSGENQKARIPRPHGPHSGTPHSWALLAGSHAVADPRHYGLELLLEDPSVADRLFSRETANLIVNGEAPGAPGRSFHDLSATSVGLLTNTATGGWRKDLSLLSETWERQPTSGLPFFRITPGTTSAASFPVSSSTPGVYPNSGMLYPWAAFRNVPHPHFQGPIYRTGAIASWANLMDYMTFHRRLTIDASGRAMGPVPLPFGHVVANSTPNHYNFIHRVRMVPVIARIQWVFSHAAAEIADSDLLEPRLLLTPVVTLWNPYNVQITENGPIVFHVRRAMPPALRYIIDGVPNPNHNAVMAGVNHGPSLGGNHLQLRIAGSLTLIPGETRVFSPATATPAAHNALIDLAPGFRTGGGHFYPVRGPAGQTLQLPGNATIAADARFDTQQEDFGAVGVGMYLDMIVRGTVALVYRFVIVPEIANDVYPPITDMAEATLEQCLETPVPFLSTMFGARSASRTHFPSKGFLQSSPFVNHTTMGRKDEVDPTVGRHYGGTAHPVNSPFDYSFVRHAPGGDSLLPNANALNARGYIVTGFSAADGLSRCVIAGLPLRPLVSLAELTHWDARHENSVPPYAINLIGNSDATPLLPSNAVVNQAHRHLAVNLQHDDSYCANHLLFDDWFLSSIAPDPGGSGTAPRDLRRVYEDFVTDAHPLANRAYRPIPEDRVSPGAAGALHAAHVEPLDSWQRIASRLEVEGMFNVNSTSETAWRALLGHARGQRVAHVRETGATWETALSAETDHPWSRFTVAADTEAGGPGSSGGFPAATEFAGYRTVDGELLDALAREVVAQVRARGPFLSLAEFVNRQLSEGELALAGTIQAALNMLGSETETDPFTELKAWSTPTLEDPPNPEGVVWDEEYRFRAAAAGYSSYGMPGWTRQADILRPIAPILSARDDTFTIRAYGDARDATGRVIVRARCEVVVRRNRDFVDPREAADITSAPELPINEAFGRRFEVISFRWLSEDEI